MKVTLYMDVYPGFNPDTAYATATPVLKQNGWRRYAIEVNIPDQHNVDAILVPDTINEVDVDSSNDRFITAGVMAA